MPCMFCFFQLFGILGSGNENMAFDKSAVVKEYKEEIAILQKDSDALAKKDLIQLKTIGTARANIMMKTIKNELEKYR